MPFDFNNKEKHMDGRSRNVPGTGSRYGFQNDGGTSARGFQNIPERKSAKSRPEMFQAPSSPVRPQSSYPQRTGRPQRRRSFPGQESMIPWKIILVTVGILLLITVLWMFKDAISAFLSQVLSWVITIIIIIILVKIFIFRR